MKFGLALTTLLSMSAIAFADEPPKPVVETESAEKSFDQLWAEAIWASLSFSEKSTEEAQQLWLELLEKAEEKDVILIALGDLEHGPKSVREDLNETVNTVEKELRARDADEPSETQRQIEIVLRRAATKAIGQKHVAELLDQFDENEEDALKYYLAAVGENPKSQLGWFRLALYSEGKVRHQAIDRLIEIDPENALPCYLKAAWFVEQSEFAKALSEVRRANRRSTLKLYQVKMPVRAQLVYPEKEQFIKADVAGEPIPMTALAYLVERETDAFAFMDPCHQLLNLVGWRFVDEATRLNEAGKFDDAIQYCEAIINMGIVILNTRPRSAHYFVSGVGFPFRPKQAIRVAYRASRQHEKLTEYKNNLEELDELLDTYMAYLNESKAKHSDLKPILLGEFDQLAHERAVVDRFIRESGFYREDKANAD